MRTRESKMLFIVFLVAAFFKFFESDSIHPKDFGFLIHLILFTSATIKILYGYFNINTVFRSFIVVFDYISKFKIMSDIETSRLIFLVLKLSSSNKGGLLTFPPVASPQELFMITSSLLKHC